MSPSKVQLSLPTFTYLGFQLTPSHKAIKMEKPTFHLPVPTTKAEVLSLLGLGFLRAWTTNCSLLA